MENKNKSADPEKRSMQAMAEAIAELPVEKKQFFVGYAEGVAAMAAQVKSAEKSEGV